VAGQTTALDPCAERSHPGVLASLRGHVRLVVVLAVLGAVLGFVVSQLLPTSYRAQSAVFLSASAPFDATGNEFSEPVRFTADQVELVRSGEVLARAGARLTPPLPAEEVRGSLTVEGSIESSKITIWVERPDAEQARALADAVAGAYAETALERVVDASSAAQDAINDGFIEEQVRLRASAYGDGVAAIEAAPLPTGPSAPLPWQYTSIGALVGVLVATALAVVRDRRKARRATVADLDMLIGAPLITRFPAPAATSVAGLLPDASPERVQAVHDVLTALDVALEGKPRRTVLFLSWQRALTTTSLVLATGVAVARAGEQVALIDGGLKERGIGTVTDSEPGRGIEGLARPGAPLGASVRRWRVQDVELHVVPLANRTPSPAGAAVRPQILRSAAARLQEIASLVLVDGPPLTERSLGLALGRGVDGVVLVIDDETSITDAHEMGRLVALAGAHILGYVLVGPARQSRMSLAPKRVGEGPVSLTAAHGSLQG
jgi:capsular polysaccharide biosynthesis protein/Mrp family chromosome partitioning ATPase